MVDMLLSSEKRRLGLCGAIGGGWERGEVVVLWLRLR
jgi:hypothetical protein